MIDVDGNRGDIRTLSVGETSVQCKQGSGADGCDKINFSDHIGEDRNRALPSLTFWLKEWEEARGILQHIDINESSLTFQGFIVRIPLNLSSDLTSLKSLIGQDISILRTDSSNHIIVRAGTSVRHRQPFPTSTPCTRIQK